MEKYVGEQPVRTIIRSHDLQDKQAQKSCNPECGDVRGQGWGDCGTGGCGEEGLAKLVCKRNVFQFLGLLGVRTGADMNLSKM